MDPWSSNLTNKFNVDSVWNTFFSSSSVIFSFIFCKLDEIGIQFLYHLILIAGLVAVDVRHFNIILSPSLTSIKSNSFGVVKNDLNKLNE